MVLFYLEKIVFLLLILRVCENNCANILLLNGVPSRSHFLWSRPIVNGLASHGHNVTILSVDIDNSPPFPCNTHYISLENVYPTLYSNSSTEKNDIAQRSQETAFQSIFSFYKFGYLGCKGSVTSKGMKTLLTLPSDHFDLIIYDFTCGPCLLGFLHHFNYPPLVSITAFSIPQFSHNLMGGSKSFSTVPHFALRYNSDMTFKQRTFNYIIHSFDQFYRNYVFLPRIQKLTQNLFNKSMPDFGTLEQRTMVMLTNSNPNIDYPESLQQNVIPVGGLQIEKPKNLSQSLQSFVESSKKGFVLFSLGTNVKANVLGAHRLHMFHSALSQITEYNFLWKLDQNNFTTNMASNVRIESWLQQTDLLAHPDIKAFISHCGLLSLHEAYWNAVPIIGIPVYVDQHRNMHKAETDGVGKKLSFNELSVDRIRDAILEVLNNGSYRDNMIEKSKLFRDQPELPLARALWWIEWALRNPKNPQTMSVNHKQFGYFRSNSFDVILCLILALMVSVYLIWAVIKIMVKLLLKRLDQTLSNDKVEHKKKA